AERAHVRFHNIAQKHSERAGVLHLQLTRLFKLDSVLSKVGQVKPFLEEPSVCVRIRTHATVALRRKLTEVGYQCSVGIKQFFRFVTTHPGLEYFQLFRIFLHRGQRHLVCSPESLELVSSHFCRRGPALRGTEHDHWPPRASCTAAAS